MSTSSVIVQASPVGAAGGKLSTYRVIKIAKPQGDQAVIVQLGYEQHYKLDFSAIANEKITLVHIGEKLIILFDNKTTVTVEPFFDSMNAPLANVAVEAEGKEFTAAEFASTFPITTDQSVLTAAGLSGAFGAPASGADFHGPHVDPLNSPAPLALLGQEELPNWTIDRSPQAMLLPVTPAPTISGEVIGIVEEEASIADSDGPVGNGNEDTNSAAGDDQDTVTDYAVTGRSVDVMVGALVHGGAQPLTFAINAAVNGTAVLDADGHAVTSLGTAVTYLQTSPTTVVGMAGSRLVFTIELTDSTDGVFRVTINGQIDHPVHSTDSGSISNGLLEETLSIDLSAVVGGHDASGHSLALPQADMFTVGVIDDTPVAQIAANGQSVAVDESPASGDEGADPFSYGSPLGVATATLVSIAGSNAGADILGSSTHVGLQIVGGDGADSGLTATDGAAIHLFLNGATVEGRVDGTNAVAFALSINDAGQLTVAQYLALHHGDAGNPNDTVSLAGKIDAVVTVTDGDGDVATKTVDVGSHVSFADDAPAAFADTDWLMQIDTAVSGNVLVDQSHPGAPAGTFGDVADSLGSDGLGAVAWTGEVGGAVTGAHGTLTVDAAGHYTYTLTPGDAAVAALPNGASLTDTFTYTVTDGDGDPATQTLTVTIFGGDHGVTISNLTPEAQGGDAGVNEANLAAGSAPDAGALTQTGSFNITAQDGIDDLTVGGFTVFSNGTFVPGAHTTPLGNVLNFISFNASTGEVTYTYTLAGPENHTAGSGTNDLFENLAVVLTDTDGSTANDTLSIRIVDDVPVAHDDTDSVSLGGATIADGNVITGSGGSDANATDGVADTAGADGVSIAWAGASGNAVGGAHGTLTVDASGNYSYQVNALDPAIQNLPNGSTLTETFNYTITDADGDASSASLTVTIVGGNHGVTITNLTPAAQGGDDTVNEANLADGSSPNSAALTQTGTFNISAPDGLDDLTVGGHAIITNGVFTATSFTTALGNAISFTGFNMATGEVTYTYTLNDNEAHPTGNGANDLFDSLSVALTDTDGSTANDTLAIRIVDDVPVAHDDFDSVKDGGPTRAEGNVITGIGGFDANATDGVADTAGADGIASISWANLNPGNTIGGNHGTLFVDSTGYYSYQLHSNDGIVAALAEGETLTDTFTYTITDGDGDTSTATLTVTIAGTNDAPIAQADTNWVKEDTSTAATGNVLQDIVHAGAPSGFFGDEIDWDVDHGSSIAVTAVAGGSVGSALAGTYGSVVINADGSYVYTLNNGAANVQALAEGQTATDTFTYTVSDGLGGSANATLTVTLFGTNDAPTAVSDTNWVKEDTGTSATGNVLQNVTHAGAPSGSFADHADTDVDNGASLSVSAVAGGSVGGTVNGTYGSIVINANGSYTYTLNNSLGSVQSLIEGQTVTDTFSYTVSDGQGGTSTANLTVTVFGTNDGLSISNLTPEVQGGDATVNEANLATGSAPNAAALAQSGSFNVSTPNGLDDLTVGGHSIIDNGIFTPTTFSTPLGNTLSFTSFDPVTGQVNYTFTLTGADHHAAGNGANSLFEDLSVVLTDKAGGTATDTLALNIIDDVPSANNHTVSASEISGTTIDVVFIVDVSGSMSTGVGAVPNFSDDRIGLARYAMQQLITNHSEIKNVQFTLFSDGATSQVWMNRTDALAFINNNANWNPNGSTNYDAALSAEMSAYDASARPAGQSDQTVVYFLSDGEPNQPTSDPGITNNGTGSQVSIAEWESFATTPANDISNVFAVGIGDGVGSAQVSNLAPISYPNTDANAPFGQEDNIAIVSTSNMGALTSTLDNMLSNVISSTGNFLVDGSLSANFGADGGHLQSIVVNGTTYTWNGLTGAASVITETGAINGTLTGITSVTAGTSAGGKLTFYFAAETGHSAGDWAYSAPMNVSSDTHDIVPYTIVDGDGDTSAATLDILVNNVDVIAPTITSNGGGATATINVNENTTAVTTVTSTDADGPAATYSIVGGADASKFTIDAGTGALSFIAAPNFESPTDSGANNSYVVQVQASDGTLTGSQTITVNVQDVNEAPSAGPDQVVSVPENVNTTTTIATVTGTDPDVGGGNDSANNFENISYSIVGGNTGGLFEIDSTGHISLASGKALDYETTQQYVLTVRVTDGPSLFDEAQITINVTNVNEAPTANNDTVITNISGSGAAIAIPDAALLLNDTDPEGQTLTISSVGSASSGSVGHAGTTTTFTDNNTNGGGFSYTAQDGGSPNLTDTASVDVNRVSGPTITGGNGDEILIGSSGNDTLDGNGGRDYLIGNGGNNTFRFDDGDSGNTIATADVIADFKPAGDIIDLSAIDAVSGGSDQNFSGNGGFTQTASVVAHGVSWFQNGADTVVQIDTNGDTANVEMMIVLTGINASALHASNFVG
jgi:VCBS repeat-containing protein